MKFSSLKVLACMVAGLVLAITSAQAVVVNPVNNVARVRITQNANQHLSLAEVQILDKLSGTDTAASTNGGTASQSTTGFGGLATRGNDGDTNGVYGAGSVTHTNVAAAGQFWEVVLGSVSTVTELSVFGRTDGCCRGRDDNLTVSFFNAAGDTLFSQDIGLFPNNAQGTFNLTFVPEPATMSLVLFAGMGVAFRRRRIA